MDYSEVKFLLAEAVERGYNVEGTAEEHYNEAIAASIAYWGGTEEQTNTYLAQPQVDYSSAPGDWKDKIGNQNGLPYTIEVMMLGLNGEDWTPRTYNHHLWKEQVS